MPRTGPACIYDTKRAGRGFVPDRGFASIGYGLPGAIGAALAGKGRPVVSLTGDGGFNMSLGDLETARRMGLSFAVVVFNNGASGYVKALQHLMYGEGAYQSSDLAETNYAKVAEAMGCTGIRVENPDELAGAFRRGPGGQAAAPSSSTWSSRAIRPRCCPPWTTARSRPRRATGWRKGFALRIFPGRNRTWPE